MAKKARKAAAKRGKAPKAKKSKAKVAKKSKKKTGKTKRKAKPTIRERISSGYHTVIDTVAGTQILRKKMEKPGTDESE